MATEENVWRGVSFLSTLVSSGGVIWPTLLKYFWGPQCRKCFAVSFSTTYPACSM